MDTKELTNQIYDTLLGNVGMSEHHIKFNPDIVTKQEVFARMGLIYLQIDNKVFEISVNRANSNFFDE